MVAEELKYTIERIPNNNIDPLPIWSRVVDQKDIKSLAEDIRKNGLINNPTVRTVNGRYQYVTGHCRGLALRKLGWETVPCKNYGEIDDETAFSIHYSENRKRKNLNPIEEALTLKKIQESLKCTLTELEAKLKEDPEGKKKAKSTIHDRLMLLELDDRMQKEVASESLPVSAGVALARCTKKFNKLEQQSRIFGKAINHRLGVYRSITPNNYEY